MEYEIISAPNAYNQQAAINNQVAMPSNETPAATALRTLAGFGANVAGSLGTGASLAQLGLGLASKGYESLTGQQSPLPERISIPYKYMGPLGELLQGIQAYRGQADESFTPPTFSEIKENVLSQLPEEYKQEPTSFVGRAIQGLGAGLLPAIATGGASAIIPLVSSTIGETAARQIGLGPGWQIGFGMLGAGIPGFLKARPGTQATKLAENYRTKLYSEADKAQKGLKVNAENIKDSLDELSAYASKTIPKESRKTVNDALIDVLDTLQMTKGMVPLEKAREAKRLLNSYLEEAGHKTFLKPLTPTNEKIAGIYRKGVGILNEQIKNVADKAPEFAKPYYAAEELSRALKAKKFIPRMIDYIGTAAGGGYAITPLARAIIGGSFGNFGSLAQKAALGVAGGVAAKELAKAYNLYSQSPIMRSLMNDMAIAAAERNIPRFAAIVSQVNNLSEGYEKQNEPQYDVISKPE